MFPKESWIIFSVACSIISTGVVNGAKVTIPAKLQLVGFPAIAERNVKSQRPLLWFTYQPETHSRLIELLDADLEAYNKSTRQNNSSVNIHDCDYDSPPPEGAVCRFELKKLNPCTSKNQYNFHKSSACILLRLETINTWIPDPYDDPADLPNDMPSALQDTILRVFSTSRANVWVSCGGAKFVDEEYLGKVEYYPRPGFPTYFFVGRNNTGYLNPIVAVHILRPTRGLLINVVCRAWAKNINNEEQELGSVRFGLQID